MEQYFPIVSTGEMELDNIAEEGFSFNSFRRGKLIKAAIQIAQHQRNFLSQILSLLLTPGTSQ
jgi:hypothetical protein